MPIDEFLNLDLESDTNNLDKLDRDSKKAAVSLERQRKALEKAQKIREQGGIFGQSKLPGGGGAPRDIARLSKRDEKIAKKLRKIEDKIAKDQVKQLGNKSSFLEDILGKRTAKNIFDMGRNPKGFLTGIAKTMPFLGGVFAAKQIADFIVDELVKIDAFFKRFVDEAERRADLVRSRLEQANISAGLAQKIITTASGGAEPRASYNTFQIFNEDQAQLEGNFALSNNSGVS